MRSIVLVALVALAVAGSHYRNNRVVLRPGVQNNVNFACGTFDENGDANVVNQAYTYTYSNLPAWCYARDNVISGVPPVGATGPWQVNVQYQGPKGSGASSFLLCLDDKPNANDNGLSWITYLRGAVRNWNFVDADDGNWVVLLPLVSNNYPTNTACSDEADNHNKAQDKINDIQAALKDLKQKLADAQALVTKLNKDIDAKNKELDKANNDEKDCYDKWDTCRANDNNNGNTVQTTISNNVFGSLISSGATTVATGATGSFISVPGINIVTNNLSTNGCSGIQVAGRGSGIVVAVNRDSIVLSNGVRLNIGSCTTKKFRVGRQNFALADNVNYEFYHSNGNVFAKTITCQ